MLKIIVPWCDKNNPNPALTIEISTTPVCTNCSNDQQVLQFHGSDGSIGLVYLKCPKCGTIFGEVVTGIEGCNTLKNKVIEHVDNAKDKMTEISAKVQDKATEITDKTGTLIKGLFNKIKGE